MNKKSTKELLVESLMELSKKKPVDKITVKEIVRNCGVSSQTFYNHFYDKYELIRWLQKTKGEELLDKLGKDGYTFRNLVSDHLDFYVDHMQFLLNALDNTSGHDSYRFNVANGFYKGLKNYIMKLCNISEIPDEVDFYLRMYAFGSTQSIEMWAREGMKVPKMRLEDYLIDCIPFKLRECFLKE